MKRGRWSKWVVLLLLVALVLPILAACGGGGQATPTKEVTKEEAAPTPTEAAAPTPKPKRPVVLNMNLGTEPPTADPGLATDTTSVFVTEQLFLGLTDFDDETSEVVPELATRWEVSEDGTVYTFYLRKDAVWTDGKPVTAYDVEYAVKRTLDPRTASDYAYVLYIIKNGEVVNTKAVTEVTDADLDSIGVKALDDYTVQFTLEYPAAYFPAIAGMWVAKPVRKDVIEKYGDKWTEPENIVSNGPYKLVEWEHDNYMRFVRNEKWYGWTDPELSKKVGNIDEIYAVMITEASTAFAMYENGELDYAGAPLAEMDRIKSDPELSKQLVIAPILCTYYYGFINTKAPFDNKLVRRAFSAAIDRQGLIDNVLKGGQQPANTFAPKGIFGNAAHDPDIAPWALPEELGGTGYAKAVEMAQQWLAEAGYPNGEGFPEVTLMFNTSEGHQKIAEAIQAMWKEALGVNVKLENQEWKVYLKTISRKTPVEEVPHIFRLGWCADYPDENNWVHEVFNSEEGSNRIRWKNEEFDQLTKQAQLEKDPEKRKELYKRAEKILVDEEAGIAPIYYYTRVTLVKPYLKRTFSPLGLGHVYLWSIDVAAKYGE